MKIALYIEDGLEQIVLTPESKVERNILEKIHDGTRELQLRHGEFYDCRGGWKRHAESQWFNSRTEERDDSTMIILRPKRETAQSEPTPPEPA